MRPVDTVVRISTRPPDIFYRLECQEMKKSEGKVLKKEDKSFDLFLRQTLIHLPAKNKKSWKKEIFLVLGGSADTQNFFFSFSHILFNIFLFNG